MKFSNFVKTIIFVFFFFCKLSASLTFDLNSWVWYRLRNWVFAFLVALSLRLIRLCKWRFNCLAGSSLVKSASLCTKYRIKQLCLCWPFWWLSIQINWILIEVYRNLNVWSWHLGLRCVLVFTYWRRCPLDWNTWKYITLVVRGNQRRAFIFW